MRAAGDSFDRYVIAALLAHGDSGDVYRASDARLRRQVALKILRQGASTNAGAAVDHPNAVAIYDVGIADGHAFAAMELVVGRTLREALHHARIEELLPWLAGVAAVLAAAHARGVTHGQVDADCARVREDGVVKILDFSVTRAAAGDAIGDAMAWGKLAYAEGADLPSYVNPLVPPKAADLVMRAIAGSASMQEAAAVLETCAAPRSPQASTMRVEEVATPARVEVMMQTPAHGMVAARTMAPLWIFAGVIAAMIAAWAMTPRTRVVAGRDAGVDAGAVMTANPEALAAYNAGMQALRDASGEAARASLDRATQLDPTFAAAHLRRMLASILPDEGTREHAQHAVQFRASLDERDRALLDAYLPFVAVPQESAEAERRLTALADARPEDAEVAHFLCRLRVVVGKYAAAIHACDRTIEIAPQLADAWHYKGLAGVYLGNVDAALEAYARCLEVSPQATSCLFDLNQLQGVEGRCEEATTTARRMIASDPETPTWYLSLAYALYGRGDALESARSAMEQGFARMSASERRVYEPQGTAALAILEGRLDRAAATLDQGESELHEDIDELDHLALMQMRTSVALESGDEAAAVRVADAFLTRRMGWMQLTYLDGAIHPAIAKLRAGGMTRDAFAATRDAWMARESSRPSEGNYLPHAAGMRWTIAYAFPSATREDAETALAVLPRFLPLPDLITRSPDYEEPIGNVYRLAGRLDEARASLERATRSCYAALNPIEHTRAKYELGLTLEAMKNRDGACAAFGSVLARWGNAKPRSITADAARAAASRLRCTP